MKKSFLPIKKFEEEPYSKIIGYPKASKRQIKSRILELEKLKINSISLYGPTTIGPYSKVGGEINNSVIIGYSNKAHDGFLGNSVLGEWCNLGADTNNSNLKNNYAEVRLWDYKEERFMKTGQLFCGLIMGDHSKSGINTMFNTGTVVGVNSNITGTEFPRNFIPSFALRVFAGRCACGDYEHHFVAVDRNFKCNSRGFI